MRVLPLLFLTTIALLSFSVSTVAAQGKRQGAGKSLGSLGRAASSAKAARATRGLSKANDAMSRINQGLGSSSGGVQRASSALNRGPDFQKPSKASEDFTTNSQRILDHRLDQAEHLRGIAARNGNEHLLETADRMEANAQENYQRQSDPALEQDATPPPTTTIPANKVSKAPRGFWFRSR
jgi:hypothetical protein